MAVNVRSAEEAPLVSLLGDHFVNDHEDEGRHRRQDHAKEWQLRQQDDAADSQSDRGDNPDQGLVVLAGCDLAHGHGCEKE